MKAVSMYPFNVGRTMNMLDHVLENVFEDGGFTRSAGDCVSRVPAVDVIEKDDAYLLQAELPGYDEDKINVSLDGGTITIETKKEDSKESGAADTRYVLRERTSATFTRSFKLPENADTETITAGFKNGLLSMEIKKRTEAQKKVIQIARA
jgi:HSP20 family protein